MAIASTVVSDAVDDFWGALHQTLQPADLADGWSEDARAASAEAMSRVRADLARGWGEMADYASHHLMRSLDYWSVDIYGTGPLVALGRAAQEALIEMRGAR